MIVGSFHRASVLVAALAFGGCDWVLRIDKIGPADASSTGDGCVPTVVELPAEADTMLSGALNARYNVFGHLPAIRLANDLRGLWRFDVSVIAIDDSVTSIELVLPYAARSDICSGTCGPCTETSGGLTIHAATSDWDELSASWHCRRNSLMAQCAGAADAWAEPGADGSDTDRSLAGRLETRTATQTTIVDIKMLRPWEWVMANKLSVLVRTSAANAVIPALPPACEITETAKLVVTHESCP